jgi:cell wall-associated NlpC family hydrolase
MSNEKISLLAINYLGSKSKKYNGDENGITMKNGFDCSGFVGYILKKSGYKLIPPRHAESLFKIGKNISFTDKQPGDLIFFSFKRYDLMGFIPTHVGIVISETHYISAGHKPLYGLVCRSTIKKTAILHQEKQIWKQNPIGFRRIF